MNLNRIVQTATRSLPIFLLGMSFCLIVGCDKDDNNDEPTQEQNDVVPSDIDDNLYRFGVNTNPYEFFNVKETPVPVGYTPFYISCYIRHGARGNVGVNYAPTIEAFTNAHANGVLNEEGERAFQQIQTIYSLDNGTDGNLTQHGAQENRQIANRFYDKYKGLFLSGNRKICAVSSTSSRCQESMAAFIGELNFLDAQLDACMDSGEQYMTYISSSAPKDIKARASELYREYESNNRPDTMYFASHLFSDVTAGRVAVGGSIEQLLLGSFSFAAISGAFDLDNTLINLFNIQDLKHYIRRLSQYIYLCQCNSLEFGDRIMALPRVGALIGDFIDKADAAILNSDYVADFRFGHDSQLLSFCAKIGVEGIGERFTTEEALNWPGWLYTPFAANFYMVFYKNDSGNIIVKCFINERETKLIGLSGGPYYAWDELKSYLYSIWNETETRGSITSDVVSYPDLIIPQE